MGNGCERGRSDGNSVLDWLQRSPPGMALGGFRATRIKCHRAANARRSCETSFSKQCLQAAIRFGSRAGEEDFQNPSTACTGQEHPSPARVRRRDGALFQFPATTAAGVGQEYPSPARVRRRNGALFHSPAPGITVVASDWKRRAAREPLTATAFVHHETTPSRRRYRWKYLLHRF
jgi:hypothetical protein